MRRLLLDNKCRGQSGSAIGVVIPDPVVFGDFGGDHDGGFS